MRKVRVGFVLLSSHTGEQISRVYVKRKCLADAFQYQLKAGHGAIHDVFVEIPEVVQ